MKKSNLNSQELLEKIHNGDFRALARSISIVENDIPGYQDLLKGIKSSQTTKILGITGPPGAGKSTLVNELVLNYIKNGKKVAVLAVDPSSPFNQGAILGDRIRLSGISSDTFFFRSLASRGFLGGLCEKIIEILELVKAAGFDIVIVETVGVGQSEIEIAGIADITALVLVPESGDSIQSMKSGIFEVADVFIVNKFDRPGSLHFKEQIHQMLDERFIDKKIEVIATVASESIGIDELIHSFEKSNQNNNYKLRLLAHKLYKLIQKRRMMGYTEQDIFSALETIPDKETKLYTLLETIYNKLFDHNE